MAERRVNFVLTARNATGRAFEAADRGLQRINDSAQILAVGGLAAVTGGLALLTTQAFKTGDSLAKVADSIGLTTKELAGFRQAGEIAGVASDQIDRAVQKVVRRAGEAVRGAQSQVEAFEALGIEVESFARLDAGEQFRTITEALGGVTNATEQAALATALFEEEGIGLLNLFNQGRGNLEAIADEAERYGTALSRVDAAQIESANDSLTRAKAAASGLGNTIAVQLAPFVAEIADRFAEAASESGGFGNEVQTAAEVAVAALGFIGDSVQAVYRGFLVLQGVTGRVRQGFAGIFGDRDDWEEGLAAADDAFRRLDESIEAGSISDRLRAEIPKIRQAARERAEAIAAAAEERRERSALDLTPFGPTPQEQAAAEREEAAAQRAAERAQEAADRQLELLRQSLLTEDEALREAYERRRLIVEENLSEEGAEALKRADLLARIEEDYQNRLTELTEKGLSDREKFQAKSSRDQVRTVTGALADITSGVAQHNKTLFQINKVAAIANATIDTAQSVTKTLAAYPYPINVALAALSAAAGAAQINAIRSTSYQGGGGGTTPSSAGTVPVINDEPVPEQAPGATGDLGGATTQIVINGNFYGNESAIQELMDEIENAVNNGDRVFIDPNSRQAQSIRGG